MAALEQANGDRYGGGFLHRMDPRTKLLLTVFFTVLIFIVDNLAVAAGLMLFFIIVCLAAKIPLRKIFSHGKALLFIILFVMLLQLFFGREDQGYFIKPLIPDNVPLIGGTGSLKRGGLFTALMIGCRIVAISVLMPALIISTEPRLLAYGITRLGINYKAAYIITSAMNMIPLFEQQARTIIDARKLRGTDSLDSGNFFSRLKEYSAIVNPLIIKAMRQSLEMSLVMDSRAFGAYKTRIWVANGQ
jgi:energy-coupling factor transport system permease protein